MVRRRRKPSFDCHRVFINRKPDSECYGGYAWAEESLLPGGTSPVIISNNDDDLVSVSELFARQTSRHRHPCRGHPQAADLRGCTRDERPNGPETTPAAPLQQQASGVSQEAHGADTGAGTGAGAANNTRKSGRARKPKRRN